MENDSSTSTVPGSDKIGKISLTISRGQLLAVVLTALLSVLFIYRIGFLKTLSIMPARNITLGKSLYLPEKIDNINFSIRYPAAWKQLTSTELAAFKGELIVGVKRGVPPVLMGVKLKKVKGNRPTLRTIRGLLDKLLSKDLNDFKRLQADLIKINNHPALDYAYTFSSDRGISIEQRQYLILSERNIYYLVFQMKSSDAKTLRPQVEAIANSLIIK